MDIIRKTELLLQRTTGWKVEYDSTFRTELEHASGLCVVYTRSLHDWNINISTPSGSVDVAGFWARRRFYKLMGRMIDELEIDGVVARSMPPAPAPARKRK